MCVRGNCVVYILAPKNGCMGSAYPPGPFHPLGQKTNYGRWFGIVDIARAFDAQTYLKVRTISFCILAIAQACDPKIST